VDFAQYWAQAQNFVAHGGQGLYDVVGQGQQLQRLVAYTTAPNVPLTRGLAPYPGVFLWLFSIFTAAPPGLGLALWTAFNALAAVWLAVRVGQLFPAGRRWWAAALALTSFPVFYTLFVGQPMILMACAVMEGYVSLRAARPLLGGLWLSMLLLKPQYAVLLLPALLLQRQWRAVVGAALGSGLIAAASLAVIGPDAVLSYPKALQDFTAFKDPGDVAVFAQMINWRGLILTVDPTVSDHAGTLLTLALGGATVVVAAWACRRRWSEHSCELEAQWVVLVLATLLANYHSHVYGSVLLVGPLAALGARHGFDRLERTTLGVLLVAPPLLFASTLDLVVTDWAIRLGLLVILGSLSWKLARSRVA
jgi:hypothetical protein